MVEEHPRLRPRGRDGDGTPPLMRPNLSVQLKLEDRWWRAPEAAMRVFRWDRHAAIIISLELDQLEITPPGCGKKSTSRVCSAAA